MGNEHEQGHGQGHVVSLTQTKPCPQCGTAWSLVDQARDAVRQLNGVSKERAMRLLTEALEVLQ